MKKNKNYNLKSINFYFKGFFQFPLYECCGLCSKNILDTGIDLDGDTVYAIPRFKLGKRKPVKLFVDIKHNRFVVLDFIPIRIKSSDMSDPVAERIMKSKAGMNIEYASSQIHTIDTRNK